MKIGIDASRNRSGGAMAHIIGILTEIEILPPEINEVHIWSYKVLLDKLPDHIWLIKHSVTDLEKSLFHQLFWQFKHLATEAKKLHIDILLNTDAGTISRFHPSVTMSRDMLSYEKGEINRFGFGFVRLRLFLLRYVQNYSLTKSEGAIFLTKYAAKVIQGYCGSLVNFAIIPHGISKVFRIETNSGKWDKADNEPVRCIYISNVDLYKHQWNVLRAINCLKLKGYNLTILFVGGGIGLAQKLFEKEIQSKDSNKKIATQMEYIKHGDIPVLLKKSDIFIFASSCENMPNTLLEGMAAGLPIACSDRGPMPEILKDGGIYFNPEKPDSIADAIESIIDNESIRLNIAKNAKELSYQYSWSRCARETFNYLIKIHEITNCH